jgi:hypothetical protein
MNAYAVFLVHEQLDVVRRDYARARANRPVRPSLATRVVAAIRAFRSPTAPSGAIAL